jgi:hypothetical protein
MMLLPLRFLRLLLFNPAPTAPFTLPHACSQVVHRSTLQKPNEIKGVHRFTLHGDIVPPRPGLALLPYGALSSKQLVNSLRTQTWLGHRLRRLGVNSRTLRIGTQCSKGYDLADFTDAFARFLNPCS